MLVRAFVNDPLHLFYFPDINKRVQQIYHLMNYSIRYCMRYGEVYTTSSKLEGVALWQLEGPLVEQGHGDKPMSLFVNWLLFRLWVGLGKALEKVISLYDYTVSIQHELVPSRHWFFFVLGVVVAASATDMDHIAFQVDCLTSDKVGQVGHLS